MIINYTRLRLHLTKPQWARMGGGAGYIRHVSTIQICLKGVLETALAQKNDPNQFQDPTIHKN